MKTFVGVDWSQAHHNIHVYNAVGADLAAFQIAHSHEGFEQLHQQLGQINPDPSQCFIGLETSHNLLVDFLWSHDYRLYVLAPQVVKSNRGRQSSSGARTDDSDAELLADILRTDRGRLLPWRPDGLLVRQLRCQLSLIDDLTASIVQYSNRLQANLQRYFPQVLKAFRKVTTDSCLQLLIAYPTPQAVHQLTYEQLAAFCRQHGYYRQQHLPHYFACLQQEAPYDDPTTPAVYQAQTPILAQLLWQLTRQKKQVSRSVQALFESHSDHDLFASLPGAGCLLAPKLLVMFGDDRDRYPSADVIRSLAGTCPATSQSGKKRAVYFRKACNRTFRHTAQLFAQTSVRQSTWAATYFAQARARGLSKSHAYRCLANRWLGIIWTLWQRQTLYDESLHWQHLHWHRQPQSPIANG